MKIESNKTNKSKLAIALKRRFGSPSALLRALGLDESLVDNGAQPDVDGTKARWAEFKQKLSEFLHEQRHAVPEEPGGGLVGRILALLDDDGAEDVGADVEGFRKLLRGAGMTEADIEKAIELAGSVGAGAAKDRLPVSGPGGMGGCRSDRARGPGEKVFATDARKVAQAEELDRMFGTARVSIGLDYGGLRRPRPAVSVLRTTATADSFEKLFSDAGRIGV